jgi:hypothetical protein
MRIQRNHRKQPGEGGCARDLCPRRLLQRLLLQRNNNQKQEIDNADRNGNPCRGFTVHLCREADGFRGVNDGLAPLLRWKPGLAKRLAESPFCRVSISEDVGHDGKERAQGIAEGPSRLGIELLAISLPPLPAEDR